MPELLIAIAALIVASWAAYRVEVRYWRDREVMRRMKKWANMTAPEASELFGQIDRFDQFVPNPHFKARQDKFDA
jgi:hypothetical protein